MVQTSTCYKQTKSGSLNLIAYSFNTSRSKEIVPNLIPAFQWSGEKCFLLVFFFAMNLIEGNQALLVMTIEPNEFLILFFNAGVSFSTDRQKNLRGTTEE